MDPKDSFRLGSLHPLKQLSGSGKLKIRTTPGMKGLPEKITSEDLLNNVY